MLSDIKSDEIRQSPPNQFWPLIKQQLDVVQICYIVYALDQWQQSGRPGGFQDFFDSHKTLPRFGSLSPSTNYRMLSNSPAFGFVYPYDLAKDAEITPVFRLIEKICNANFSRKELYQHIVDAQLEKIYVNSNPFRLHTIMFLFKILIVIGDLTGDYSISTTEMKLFVVTARKWSDYVMVAESIIRYRNDADYRRDCDANISKFKDSRYNNLINNHSCIQSLDNRIILVENAIKPIRLKIAGFENLSPAEIARRMHEDYITEPQAETALPDGKANSGLQKIVYGAPGSGKSYAVRNEVQGKAHKRVTFHPDTDYSSFVGAYKPVQDGDKIRYTFAPRQFAIAYIEAWTLYLKNPAKDYFLVIEEINRGNCAQIFGDIFQLLDRNASGFSEYPISIDYDFASFIKVRLSDNGILDRYLSYFEENADCSLIMLPPNFHIIATMNTSDQSLFPMDSAFKRRWEWIYIPIDHRDASQFTIYLDETHQYNWGEFIVAVNDKIYQATGSPDKQLGNRFVQPGTENIIDRHQFQSKVLFYLWEEVFKDNRRHSIFEKDKGFYKIYDNVDEISHIIEDVLKVTNTVVPDTDNPAQPTSTE